MDSSSQILRQRLIETLRILIGLGIISALLVALADSPLTTESLLLISLGVIMALKIMTGPLFRCAGSVIGVTNTTKTNTSIDSESCHQLPMQSDSFQNI